MSAPRTPAIAQRLVGAYITSLRQRLPTSSIRQLDQLPGATEEQITRLRQAYPGVPLELVSLLQRANGTCWEALKSPEGASNTPPPPASSSASPFDSTTLQSAAAKTGAASQAASFIKSTLGLNQKGNKKRTMEKIAVPILGSALGACPYYLKSVEQMLSPLQSFPPLSATAPRQPGTDDVDSQKLRSYSDDPQQQQQQQHSTTTTATPPPLSAASAFVEEQQQQRSEAETPAAANSIATLYSGYQIVREAPKEKATSTATVAPVTKEALPSIVVPSTNISFSEEQVAEKKVAPTVYVDPRIDINVDFANWLVFADSIYPHHQRKLNRAKLLATVVTQLGGAKAATNSSNSSPSSSAGAAAAAVAVPSYRMCESRMYIDFHPDELHEGRRGQVIQYVRNPDSFTVISTDFGEYLKFLMADEYEFTEDLEDDEEEEEEEPETIITTSNGVPVSSSPTPPRASG